MSAARAKGGIAIVTLMGIGLAVAFALVFFVSPEASSKPDGLNKVAIDKGFSHHEETHALDNSPTAGYAVKGIDNERLSTGVAGIIGVAVVFTVSFGLFALVRRGRRRGVPLARGA